MFLSVSSLSRWSLPSSSSSASSERSRIPPNEGSGEGQACRSFSEARCVVSLFRSSARQEIVINGVRAELSVLAQVSSGVVPVRVCRPATSFLRAVRTEVVGAGHPGSSGEPAARGSWSLIVLRGVCFLVLEIPALKKVGISHPQVSQESGRMSKVCLYVSNGSNNKA